MNPNLMYHKKSPEIFLNAFKKALSYFPELHDAYILIHETHLFGVQHTLRAYPPLTVLHWRKSKWVYPIVINRNKDINMSFYDLTFDQQVGALAHELSHIVSYVSFSRCDILHFSIKYAFSKEFVRRIEKETDLRAIERGVGLDLLSERIALFGFRTSIPYPETEDTYIAQSEIIEILKKYPDLYSQEKIWEYISILEKIKEKGKQIHLLSNISISRKIKHSIKTVCGFIPEFMKMFYIVTIRKTHLK